MKNCPSASQGGLAAFKVKLSCLLGLVLCGILLTACASNEAPYMPASEVGKVGYWDSRISTDRYRVSYTGYADSPLELVQNYALLRAAQLTLEQNYDWFEVAERTVIPYLETENSQTTTIELSSGTPSQVRCELIGCATPQTQTSPAFPQDELEFSTQREHLVSSIEIVMGRGDYEDSANIYDPQQVISLMQKDL